MHKMFKSFVIDATQRLFRDDYDPNDAAANSSLPKLERVQGSSSKWVLVEDWHCSYDNYRWTVPKGFVTDGASIPRWLWPVCGTPMEKPRIYVALLHDYLYTILPKEDPDPNGAARRMADKVYRDYNIQLGMSKFRSNFEYRFLRWFGGSHWGDEEE